MQETRTMDEKKVINKMSVVGEVIKDAEFSHEVKGKVLYCSTVKSKRLSGYEDIIPVVFDERYKDIFQTGKRVEISGSMRTLTYHDEEMQKNRLKVYCFVYDAFDAIDEQDSCKVELEGYLCKDAIVRKTPQGREISDICIAVNTSKFRSEYIPAIAWGILARNSGDIAVGSKVHVIGRFQSREYTKVIDDVSTPMTAYELSLSTLEVIE